MNLKKVKVFLGRVQLYLSRTSTYFQMANTLMIVALFLQNTTFGEKYGNVILLLLIPLVGGILFIGYLDEKFGFLSEVLKARSKNNPLIVETLENTREIKKKLSELK